MSERSKLLLTLAASVLFALLAAELGLRVYQRVARGVPILTLLPGYRDTRFGLSPFLVFGPRLDWQIPDKREPELAYFNRQGFRTREAVGPKPPGELRIVALGGSTTENVWNDEGLHWPLVLERELHAAGRTDVRVYNGAMSAYSTAHSLVRLAFDVLRYEPDVVIVMHNLNDLTVNYFAARDGSSVDANYLVKYGRQTFIQQVEERDLIVSRLGYSIRRRLRQLFPRTDPSWSEDYDLAPGLALFRRNLRSLAAVARAHDSELVALTMPATRDRGAFDATRELRQHPLPSYDRFFRDFDAYNDAIRALAAGGIPVIDMAERLPEEDGRFADIVHYTSAGVEAFGRTLAPALLEILPRPRH